MNGQAGGVGPILGLLMAGLGILVSFVFLPVIQGFTNSTNESLMTALNTSGMADTPLTPIMHLWPVWSILLILVCVIIVFAGLSKQG